jgi:hypothetical protein
MCRMGPPSVDGLATRNAATRSGERALSRAGERQRGGHSRMLRSALRARSVLVGA